MRVLEDNMKLFTVIVVEPGEPMPKDKGWILLITMAAKTRNMLSQHLRR